MDNENQKSSLNYGQFIAGTSLCAFLMGILYPFTYYAFFFFNVFDYMELNEIAIHAIRDGMIILLPYFLFYYIGFIHSKSSNSIANNETNDRVRTTSKFFLYFLRIGLAVLYAFYIYEYVRGKTTLPMLLFFIFSSFYAYIIEIPVLIRNKLLPSLGYKINAVENLFLITIVLTMYGSITLGLTRADSVKFSHSTTGTYILMNKDTIKSDSKYYYIGRTNKYVFFFNEKLHFVDVYPEKDINKLSLH